MENYFETDFNVINGPWQLAAESVEAQGQVHGGGRRVRCVLTEKEAESQ